MHLYIHIPFCASKCRYCGFFSETVATASLQNYPRLLQKEYGLRRVPESSVGTPIATVYIGGGTPSLLPPDALRELFSWVPAGATEVTMEANPADVTAPLACAMREAGITRVSIGAQSLNDATLRFLGRRHTATDTARAVEILRAHGFEKIGLDLICAIPGDTAFHDSLRAVVALDPVHVSVYTLSYEPGTPLARDAQAGKVEPVSDDASLCAMRDAETVLSSAGFDRYEISNFAKPGFECAHNLGIWRGDDYLGLGAGAVSRIGLIRRTNIENVAAWQSPLERDELPPSDEETVSPEFDATERFLTRLRLAEGVVPDARLPDSGTHRLIMERLQSVGIMHQTPNGTYALTSRGREVADAVMREFM